LGNGSELSDFMEGTEFLYQLTDHQLLSKDILFLRYFMKYLHLLVAAVKKTDITAVGIRRAEYATPSVRKSWH
jgi:hypothetical protein